MGHKKYVQRPESSYKGEGRVLLQDFFLLSFMLVGAPEAIWAI